LCKYTLKWQSVEADGRRRLWIASTATAAIVTRKSMKKKKDQIASPHRAARAELRTI
jgi:hypothetical protein